MNARISLEEWKCLWATLWRMLLLLPVMLLLGAAILVLILTVTLLPIAYALLLLFTGQVFWGLLVVAGWGFLMRWFRPLLPRLLQGLECCGI